MADASTDGGNETLVGAGLPYHSLSFTGKKIQAVALGCLPVLGMPYFVLVGWKNDAQGKKCECLTEWVMIRELFFGAVRRKFV